MKNQNLTIAFGYEVNSIWFELSLTHCRRVSFLYLKLVKRSINHIVHFLTLFQSKDVLFDLFTQHVPVTLNIKIKNNLLGHVL